MQLPLKVNACGMVQPCTCLVLWGTSQNEIKSVGIESGSPVVRAVCALRRLSANSNWDCNLRGKSTTTLILVTLPTYTWPSSYNNWWLRVSTIWGHANNYALVHEAFSIQMHIPSTVILQKVTFEFCNVWTSQAQHGGTCSLPNFADSWSHMLT